MSTFDTLLIPVESQVRELDGKILLACAAAEKGFNTIIGSRAYIHHHSSKVRNAIYLAKSMRRFSNRMFKIMHGLGHRIVAWDEEGLVRLPDDQYYIHRLSPTAFGYIDHVFAWGNSDAQVFKNYSSYNNQPIHIAGNPRIDILRPELRSYFSPEKNKIIEEHGDYILINTNFGQVNHYIPTVGSDEANRDKNFSGNSDNDFIANRFKHKQTLFNEFKNVIPLLANTFPSINIIVRPHPSENVRSWQQLFAEHKNIKVTNSRNVIPWIMGSKALISNGCTTSIEATILNTPTLGYYPITNDQIDDLLPKALCDIASNSQQLIDKIEPLLTTNKSVCNNYHLLSEHISSLKGDFATDKIVNTLFQHYTKTPYAKRTTIARAPSVIHNNARTLVKRIKSRKSSHRNSAAYHKHRFPPINIDYLHERIARYQNLTGRFSAINISQISDDIFKLHS
ncbi:MAG: surface carbohydrate biosynthesis protein [Gammaproteobacteria bacterium]